MKGSSFIRSALVALFFLVSCGMLFAGGNKEVPEIPPVSSGTQYISPNGDGVQDAATLSFTVNIHVKSKEGYVPLYGLQIIAPDGSIVREVTETEKSDIGFFASLFSGYKLFTMEREVSWDGTGPDGNLVDDGVYNVRVYVVDSSKNRQELAVDDFIVDTKAPEAVIEAPSDTLFSPNGDDVAEVFIVQQEGSVEALWKGEILDETGAVVKTFSWENEALADLLWDGTNDAKTKAPDGVYEYRLSCTDLAGNVYEGFTLSGIELDAATPKMFLHVDNPNFSPNRDGVKDTATVTSELEDADQVVYWSGSFVNDRMTVHISADGKGPAPSSYTLTGFTDEGEPLPEGFYTLSLSVQYENGYRGVAQTRIQIDTTPPSVTATYDRIFSPNGDGQQDVCDVSMRASEQVEWYGELKDENGQTVLTTDSTMTATLVRWDGRDADGALVPDGTYYASAVFTDLAGNSIASRVLPVRVDNRYTGILLTVPAGFSPNGDGLDDVLPVAVEAQITGEVSRWVLTVEDENEESVKVYTGQGELPDTIFWDGTLNPERGDENAPEGFYTVRLKTVYEKGDVIQTVSERFTLDNTPPRLSVKVVATPFAETDAGLSGDMFVTIAVEEETEVTDWELDILNSKGEVVRSYVGTGDPTGQIAWNGEMDDPAKASDDDTYTVRLNVTDAGGNQSLYEESMPIDILIVFRDGKYYLMVPNIIFGAYKHTLDSAGEAMHKRNMESLKKVVELIKRYPEYSLGLEGHALNIYRGGPREDREEAVLQPLTVKRAETVFNALVKLGFPADKLSYKAYGGTNPIASVSDRRVWWKNRRVEFVVLLPEPKM
ncbi:MAG: gliding motility-associated C-terminal domain-containing protein [Spirochaetales bacterium]|nr:gliding motility-associated C-terminal domain-containing protein [Spirochaetales bacterium]